MLRILVVEDESMVALDLCLQLEDAGFGCLGPAPDVASAMEIIDRVLPDVGVLDANLDGSSSAHVAERPKTLGVPFVYVSGYSKEYVDENLPPAPLISKPVRIDDLVSAIRRLGDGAGSAAASGAVRFAEPSLDEQARGRRS